MSGNMTALFLTITMACLSAAMIALTLKDIYETVKAKRQKAKQKGAYEKWTTTWH